MPPDLELRVTLSDDQRTLHFMLHSVHSEVGVHFTPAGSVRLACPPQEHLGYLFDELNILARKRLEERSVLQQEQIRARLESIGQNLYRDLFSPELKQAYRRFRDSLRGKSVLITSDEPWIPWEMVKLLEQGEVSLWHFVCHGNFNSERPGESAVELADGELRPSDSVGPKATGVKLARPLVFLNACHTSQLGFALTGLDGWAERFVNAGASGFVGSAREVHDELAAEFAVKFYDELWDGAPLGEAFHRARLHVKGLDETNPTWLAYTLYGDPMGGARIAAL